MNDRKRILPLFFLIILGMELVVADAAARRGVRQPPRTRNRRRSIAI
jgi:hypothetical protein